MIINEEEKLRLMEDIDQNSVELLHKREQVAAMAKTVEEKKAKYKALK
jgi:hypothetical protein